MGERTLEMEVLRYNPETDREPRFQRYTIACPEEWVVLDALNHVKETLDPTLSYRWSCHMAVCGSCGMMVNGEPKLACKAFLRDYPGTVCMTCHEIEPLLTKQVRHAPVAEGREVLSPEGVLRLQEFAAAVHVDVNGVGDRDGGELSPERPHDLREVRALVGGHHDDVGQGRPGEDLLQRHGEHAFLAGLAVFVLLFEVLGGDLIERTGGDLGGGNAQPLGLGDDLFVLQAELLRNVVNTNGHKFPSLPTHCATFSRSRS